MKMIFCKIVFLFVIFFVLRVATLNLGVKNSESYGPYDLVYPEYSLCKGPMSKDVANLTLALYYHDSDVIAHMNVIICVPTRLEVIKIRIYTLKGNNKKLLWNYNIEKPCQHFFIAETMKQLFDINDNCDMKKKNHTLEMNFSDYARQFFGTSFFYGNYYLKVYGITSNGNLMCIYLNMVVKKKI